MKPEEYLTLLESSWATKKIQNYIKEAKKTGKKSESPPPLPQVYELIDMLDDKFDMYKESHLFAMIDDIGTSLDIGGYWKNHWHPSAIKYITEDNINRATELLYNWHEYHKTPTKEEIKKLIESIFRIRQTRLEL